MTDSHTNEITRETSKKGYPRTPRKRIIEHIQNDEKIKHIITRVAKRNNIPQFLVQRRARKILKKLCADLSRTAIAISYQFFKRLWKKLYTRLHIDLGSISRIRPVIENNPTILIPSHKSHIDYLLLSSIFHENDLVPPYIAAGANLSFWPFGYIFRKTGAFFIRRSIGSDILYYKILFKYMSYLIKEKGTQEFFIEGGRSRNGKLQDPKVGLLTLQIEAFLEQGIADLYFIPISLAYDRILEENAYYAEITGGHKVKESFLEVVKSMKALKSNYGNAYVTFGKPLSLKDHIAKYTEGKLTPKLKKTMIKDLTVSIIKDINAMTPVTPTSLVALVLLSQSSNEMAHSELLKNSRLYLSYLKNRGVNIPPTLGAGEKSLLSGIILLTEAKFLEATTKENSKIYRFKNRNRISLDYYKNNIIHYCVPLLFISASLAKENSKTLAFEKLEENYNFLGDLFQNEFYVDRQSKNGDLKTALKWMENEKIVSIEAITPTSISISDETAIKTFASALRNYLEAYYATACALEKVVSGGIEIADAGLETTLLEAGLKMLRKNAILNREAVTTPYIRNALKYINKKKIHPIKQLIPLRDLEEEEDIAEHDPIYESDHDRLHELIASLKKFLN